MNRRVLIKISGEAIAGTNGESFDFGLAAGLCRNIKDVIDTGIGVSLVIGGGNVIRGRQLIEAPGTCAIRKETADNMGMLSTVMNGLLFRDVLGSMNVTAELVSNLRLPFGVCPSDSSTVGKIVDQGKVVIFVGGVALPYFSTDTISVIGAAISGCDTVLKATKTDGIYDKDPNAHADAVHLPRLTFDEALSRDLGPIFDKTAIILAAQRQVKILVFSIKENNCFTRALAGDIKMSEVASVALH